MIIELLELEGHPDFDRHERVVECRDQRSGLHAFIAVHNTNRGPALGGCRMWPYGDRDAALRDVLRLSRGMSYKSALAGLPLGGGKAVIVGDPRVDKTRDLLRATAEFVESLDGLYITAEDSGTSVEDMRIMSEFTSHAAGISPASAHGGDPSPTTAYGAFIGLRRAIWARLGADEVDGLRVAIQGVGNVGFHLAEHLVKGGASVTVADIDERRLERAVDALGVSVVAPDRIHAADVDVYSPCAMGGAINDRTLPELRAMVVAGAANNQLAAASHGKQLHDRGVLYAPDYAMNAGGIIDICHQLLGHDHTTTLDHVESTARTMDEIFGRAAEEDRPTQEVADELAEERLHAAPRDGAERHVDPDEAVLRADR